MAWSYLISGNNLWFPLPHSRPEPKINTPIQISKITIGCNIWLHSLQLNKNGLHLMCKLLTLKNELVNKIPNAKPGWKTYSTSNINDQKQTKAPQNHTYQIEYSPYMYNKAHPPPLYCQPLQCQCSVLIMMAYLQFLLRFLFRFTFVLSLFQFSFQCI